MPVVLHCRCPRRGGGLLRQQQRSVLRRRINVGRCGASGLRPCTFSARHTRHERLHGCAGSPPRGDATDAAGDPRRSVGPTGGGRPGPNGAPATPTTSTPSVELGQRGGVRLAWVLVLVSTHVRSRAAIFSTLPADDMQGFQSHPPPFLPCGYPGWPETKRVLLRIAAKVSQLPPDAIRFEKILLSLKRAHHASHTEQECETRPARHTSVPHGPTCVVHLIFYSQSDFV